MKSIPSVLCLLCLLMTIQWTHAQEKTHLSGQVFDKETNAPLAFSTVTIAGTNNGAVSNFEGYFNFPIEPHQVDDTLLISMLGYKPIRLLISEINDYSNLKFSLEESVILLEEVEISDRKLTALEIVNKVIDNIPNNYPNAPYLLEGFTRSHKHECGKYVTLYEAAFELNGKGYQKKNPEKIFISESRQSLHRPYYHSQVLRSNRNLYNSMSHINDVLYRNNSLQTSQNKYVIDKYLIDGEDLIYVIKTNHSKYVNHTLYVNGNDFTLLKVKMEMTTPEGEDWNPYLNKGSSSDSLDFKVTRLSKTIQFEKQNDRYFSKYMDWLVEGKLLFSTSKKEFCDWGFRFENMFGKVQYPYDGKLSNDRLMNPRSKKDPPPTVYHPAFWESFSLLKEFPISPDIVSDLEINKPLESQFKQMSQ